jgi:hypothetical protein
MYTNIRMRTAPETMPIAICSVCTDARAGDAVTVSFRLIVEFMSRDSVSFNRRMYGFGSGTSFTTNGWDDL